MRSAPPCPPTRRRSLSPRARRGALASAIALTLAAGAAMPTAATAATDDLLDDSAIAPHEAAYGVFVDRYRDNTSANATPATNPAIGVLSGMLQLWQPGATWDTGTALDAATLDANIAYNVEIASTRTDADEAQAWIFDRRHQSYSAIDGLGSAADDFRAAMGAATTIPDAVPADATTVRYDDGGNADGDWADPASELGSVVTLVDTLRGSSASTNPSKNYYSYKRPFRWVDDSVIVDTLLPVRKPDSEAQSDGGFPSGHTNAAFLASYALADAAPQYQAQLIAHAAEIGDSRIVAGMHSPLDVIGGRVLSTALAAATLNDPANAEVRAAAEADAQELLATLPAADELDYDALAAEYLQRLTYGLAPTGDTTVPARVPTGAEVLLENRLPYLDAQQRRWVLHSTAIASGHAVLDDAEGWGRLNLFEASNGFGAFDTDVTVTMDAAAGGASAADEWRNDIEGAGSLVKAGTGALTLSGENSYSGGTVLDEGSLVAASATALGAGDVTVEGGVLVDDATALRVAGDLVLAADGTVALGVDSAAPALSVDGAATLGGTLRVALSGDVTAQGHRLISYGALTPGSAFDAVEVDGAPAGFEARLDYRADGVYLVDAAVAPEPEPTPEPTSSATPEPQASATVAPAAAERRDGQLARTGGEGAPLGAVMGALALVAAGAAALLVRRRRQSTR